MLTVYSKTFCPYCIKAKNYLKLKAIKFKEINIEQTPEAKDFMLKEGHRTVPQIYKDGKLFVKGGCDGLLALSHEELMARLKA